MRQLILWILTLLLLVESKESSEERESAWSLVASPFEDYPWWSKSMPMIGH
jgi:hypothetical protein